jgi:hypothetical protein
MKMIFIFVLFFIGILIITALPASAAGVKDGLLVFFTFDKAIGDQVTDMSGNKHDGTLKSGAKIVTDIKKYGTGAIRIEGATQQMEVKTFKELEEYVNHTYLFWIYFTAPPTGGWDSIFAKPAPGSDRSPGAWATAQGTLAIHWRYNPGNAGFQALGPNGEGSAFDKEKWYHVAGVKKGTDLSAYVDGKNVGKATVPAAITQGVYSLFIGQSPAYGGSAAKFIMDDFFGYNRVLADDEINTLMTKGAQAFPVEPKDKLTSTWGNIKDGN